MPLHDVSDAFDPDFWDTITVIRRQQTTSNKGRGGSIDMPTAGVLAVITPATGSVLDRLPDYDVSKKYIAVVTPFRLQLAATGPGGITYKPDLVQWAGDTFIVQQLDDASRYGIGFVEAVCSSLPYQDPPPTPITPVS